MEGRGPIAAVGTDIVEIGIFPVASGGKENAGAVLGAGHQTAVDAVQSSPVHIAVSHQLRPLVIRRHTPAAAQFHVCDIVVCLEDRLVIDRASVTTAGIVLSEGAVRAIAPLVRRPVVAGNHGIRTGTPTAARIVLTMPLRIIRLRLAPGVVVAVILGRTDETGLTQVAGGPLDTQT